MSEAISHTARTHPHTHPHMHVTPELVTVVWAAGACACRAGPLERCCANRRIIKTKARPNQISSVHLRCALGATHNLSAKVERARERACARARPSQPAAAGRRACEATQKLCTIAGEHCAATRRRAEPETCPKLCFGHVRVVWPPFDALAQHAQQQQRSTNKYKAGLIAGNGNTGEQVSPARPVSSRPAVRVFFVLGGLMVRMCGRACSVMMKSAGMLFALLLAKFAIKCVRLTRISQFNELQIEARANARAAAI